MSHQRTLQLVLIAAVALCILGPLPSRASAAPSTAQTAADSARVEAAVRRFERTRALSAATDTRLAKATASLDAVVAEQQSAQERLNSRASAMYRSGNTGLISMVLGAATFQELTTRWDFLVRFGKENARDLLRLKRLRARTERSATSMLELQSSQARAVDELAREVAGTRKELASSQAALAAYRARTAAATAAKPSTAATPARPDTTPQVRGSGAWSTAVASHYGRNFSGRGANGELIGPYSMIVAHKTLPFGTLIEFEYRGKRAIARVTDRGPHVAGRTFDLGPGVVRVLNFNGVDEVRYRIIKR